MKEIELKIPNLGEAEDTEIIEISVIINFLQIILCIFLLSNNFFLKLI